MSCEQMGSRLIAYLDGRATEADRREVELHLKGCMSCQVRADEYRRLWTLLDEVPPLEPSASFDARLRARIAAEPRQPWYAWLAPSPRLAMTVALLAALAVWVGTTPRMPEEIAIQDEELKLLQDYDVLANFDALSELPRAEKRTM